MATLKICPTNTKSFIHSISNTIQYGERKKIHLVISLYPQAIYFITYKDLYRCKGSERQERQCDKSPTTQKTEQVFSQWPHVRYLKPLIEGQKKAEKMSKLWQFWAINFLFLIISRGPKYLVLNARFFIDLPAPSKVFLP